MDKYIKKMDGLRKNMGGCMDKKMNVWMDRWMDLTKWMDEQEKQMAGQ